MPSLQSELFRGDARLETCLVRDSAHVTLGTVGEFVSKIQYALLVLQGGRIPEVEIRRRLYGRETAAIVLAYKRRRRIINFSYQQAADDIVGKMTIRALDADMLVFEARERLNQLLPKPPVRA